MEFGATAVELQVAEVVDAEEVEAAVVGDGLGELLLIGGLDEFVDQLRAWLNTRHFTDVPAHEVPIPLSPGTA